MKFLSKIVLVFGLLFSSLSYASVPITTGMTIDYGGNVFDRLMVIDLLKKSQVPVEITGVCISACTMYLGLPKVCVKPGTIFGFHSASNQNEKGQWVKSKFGNSILMQSYPNKIKKWVQENKALDSLELTFANSETMWELGIPKCNG